MPGVRALAAALLATSLLSGCTSTTGGMLDSANFAESDGTSQATGAPQFAVLGTTGGQNAVSTNDGAEGASSAIIPLPTPSPRNSQAAAASEVVPEGSRDDQQMASLQPQAGVGASPQPAAAAAIADLIPPPKAAPIAAETMFAVSEPAPANAAQPEPSVAQAAAQNVTALVEEGTARSDATASLAAGSNAQAASAVTPGAPVNEVPQTASQPERKPSFFERLAQSRAAAASAKPAPGAPKPEISIGNETVMASATGSSRAPVGGSALPGVASGSSLFGIAGPDDSPSPGGIPAAGGIQVASAAGLGRMMSPSGLLLQTEKVEVDCFKPDLLKILKIVERRYGKRVMVTSGYRSPARNRSAGGVQNSTHINCMAADIQVEGVSKWDLAKFLRTVPGRGGVGTYCRTESVHIDIGTERDWHHPCRSGGSRARKKA